MEAAPALIEPSEFDLVVIGTGLPESIVAAAAAKAGRSVLQLDPSAHYGGAWASLRLNELEGLLQQGGSRAAAAAAGANGTAAANGSGPAVDGTASSSSSSSSSNTGASEAERAEAAAAAAAADIVGAEVWRRPGIELGAAQQYSLDLAPKVMYGAGPTIQLLLGSGAHHYLEFKLVQGSYMLQASAGGAAQLRTVPSSRADVFKDRQLSPLQKRSLMRFLKAAAEALDGEGPLKDAFGGQPILTLLEQQGLDRQLQQSLLYGVLLDEGCAHSGSSDGGGGGGGGGSGDGGSSGGGAGAEATSAAAVEQQQQQQQQQGMTAAEALERLRLFVQSAGRYGPDTGPFLTPLYGCGELPQAFCRSAAVAGAVQVLRCGIQGLSFDEHTFSCDGVELASGQTIRCQQLAAGEAALHEWLATFQPAATTRLTLRCCAILDGPPVPGEQQSLVAVLPADSQAAGGHGSGMSGGDASGTVSGGPAVVRALALCGSTAVCPQGQHLVYLWADGGGGSDSSSSSEGQSGGATAAAALLPALAALADTSGLQGPAGSTPAMSVGEGGGSGNKPAVLWAAFYAQRSTHLLNSPAAAQPGGGGRWPANVALCPGPDSSLTFVSAVEAAKACYWRLFPPEGSAAAVAPEGAAAAAGEGADPGAAEPAQGRQQQAALPPFPLDPQARRPQSAGEEGEANGAAGTAGEADADSDDEALAALQAALRQVASGGGSTPAAAQAADGASVGEAAAGAAADEQP